MLLVLQLQILSVLLVSVLLVGQNCICVLWQNFWELLRQVQFVEILKFMVQLGRWVFRKLKWLRQVLVLSLMLQIQVWVVLCGLVMMNVCGLFLMFRQLWVQVDLQIRFFMFLQKVVVENIWLLCGYYLRLRLKLLEVNGLSLVLLVFLLVQVIWLFVLLMFCFKIIDFCNWLKLGWYMFWVILM